MPAGMYYIVVSGWGTSEGDYVLNVSTLNPPSPVAGYNVYRDGVEVGYVEGVDVTSFSEFVYSPEMPEGGTYTYAVSAYYDVQDASSVQFLIEALKDLYHLQKPLQLQLTSAAHSILGVWWQDD